MAPLGIDTRGGGPEPTDPAGGAVRYTARSLRLGRPWTAQSDDVRPPPLLTCGARGTMPPARLRAAARAPGPRLGPQTGRETK